MIEYKAKYKIINIDVAGTKENREKKRKEIKKDGIDILNIIRMDIDFFLHYHKFSLEEIVTKLRRAFCIWILNNYYLSDLPKLKEEIENSINDLSKKYFSYSKKADMWIINRSSVNSIKLIFNKNGKIEFLYYSDYYLSSIKFDVTNDEIFQALKYYLEPKKEELSDDYLYSLL